MSKHDTEHVKFVLFDTSPSGKTKLWKVLGRGGNIELGVVAWFSRWRKYAFYPNFETVYDDQCLNTIAEFVKRVTSEHRNGVT